MSRPKMLKDFLIYDSNSCSSSGFSSFPRINSCNYNTSSINSTTNSLLLTRSTKSKSKTISTFQSILDAVKNIHFNAVKSPSFLPRALSRKLSSSKRKAIIETKRTVTIKDIIRWKSFSIQNESTPLDLITGSTTTTSSSCGSSSSTTGSSSWCDSDFTSECYLPCGEINELEAGKKYLRFVGVGGDATCTAWAPKEEEEEEEQYSPVSVMGFKFEDEINEVEEKAWELLRQVKQTSLLGNNIGQNNDQLLLDFFIEELTENGKINNELPLDNLITKRAKACICNEEGQRINGEYGYKKEVYIKEMDKQGKWSQFEEEKQELVMLIENTVLNFLLDELLFDVMSFL